MKYGILNHRTVKEYFGFEKTMFISTAIIQADGRVDELIIPHPLLQRWFLIVPERINTVIFESESI